MKRLLVLTPRFPYPMIGGDRLRILHICRALRSEFELTLLSLCESSGEMRYVAQDGLFTRIERVHLPRWKSCLNTLRAIPGARPLQLAYYESPEFRERVNVLLPQHDLILAHLIRTGQYIEHASRPTILEMTDAISMNYARMPLVTRRLNWKRLVYRLEQQRLNAYECRSLWMFDRVWVTSGADRSFLDPNGACPIEVIPNGADLHDLDFQLPPPGANVIVFIGNMNSLQNQDACHYFIQDILPRVQARAHVVFRIVGNASKAVQRQFLRYSGVQMTGRIERIQDGVRDAFCGVCPLRSAAGIQNKVLEYLALGVPCVTSMMGLGGIEARPGEDLLAFTEPRDAAKHILALYSDPDLRARIAASGRKLVCERYDWRRIYQSFVDSSRAVAATE